MKTMLVVLGLCLLKAVACAQGVVGVADGTPSRLDEVVFYDSDFCFGFRSYGDGKDAAVGIQPALFVHSKAHKIWMRVTKIATAGGTFGKFNPGETKEAPLLSVGWNLSALASQKHAEVPIHTGSALAFPDAIVYDAKKACYRLGFMTRLKIPSAETWLIVPKRDLVAAFEAAAKP